MICEKCVNKDVIIRGVKIVRCIFCQKETMIPYNGFEICENCSNEQHVCQLCGNEILNLKTDTSASNSEEKHTYKCLGKIVSAEYGMCPDMPFLFGLQLRFSFKYGNVSCGGCYTVNISSDCKWDSKIERADTFVASMGHVYQILKDANVCHVSQLNGKPVEIELENRKFKNFRILTEVI